MKVVALSLFLALIPIALLVAFWLSTPTVWPPTDWTVDNLFGSIILLTLSGIFVLSAGLEVRAAGGMKNLLAAQRAHSSPVVVEGKPVLGALVETGMVEDVQYFESPVGGINKCIVLFRPDGSDSARLLTFFDNVKEQLPVGKRVQIAYRPEGAALQLLTRSYV
ncbi:MAG: hypothetical protein JO041_09925 [Acidobacteria bacterium]|nr:hypothetical protein [Acidobacteriota bacterium]